MGARPISGQQGMEKKCLNCGCKAPFDWPDLVRTVAFSVMFLLWAHGGYQLGWVGLLALFLYLIGMAGMKIRNNRDSEAAKRPRTPVADEIRDRIRSETSQ